MELPLPNPKAEMSPIVDMMVEAHLRNFNALKDDDERIASLTFLCEVWLHWTAKINTMGDVGNEIVKMLHGFCKQCNSPTKIAILSMMFELLQNFAGQKNKFAPVLYKSLTYILIENHNDEMVRMHIL